MLNNLGLFVAKRAIMDPDREALVDLAAARRYSYAELDARCNRLANGLVAVGLEKGDRVATLLMNGAPFVETFFGAAKVGGVIVALNWRLVADELSYILLDSGAEILIFGTACRTGFDLESGHRLHQFFRTEAADFLVVGKCQMNWCL